MALLYHNRRAPNDITNDATQRRMYFPREGRGTVTIAGDPTAGIIATTWSSKQGVKRGSDVLVACQKVDDSILPFYENVMQNVLVEAWRCALPAFGREHYGLRTRRAFAQDLPIDGQHLYVLTEVRDAPAPGERIVLRGRMTCTHFNEFDHFLSDFKVIGREPVPPPREMRVKDLVEHPVKNEFVALQAEIEDYFIDEVDARYYYLSLKSGPHRIYGSLKFSDANRAILERNPKAKIIVLTSFGSSAEMAKAIKAGAVGALQKESPSEELIDAINAVMEGRATISPEIAAGLSSYANQPELTERQLDILAAVAAGNLDKNIADQFHISIAGVRKHLNTVMAKLGASSRTEAVAIALRKHLLKA